MSCRSFRDSKSSFTPYHDSMDQKEISLFSRLNLNDIKDKKSFQNPLRGQLDSESSDLFSMRSRKRKGSAEFLQLKQSLPGNKTFLNMSLVGKSSLHHHDMFGHEAYQDIGMGLDDDDPDKKQYSQKSCPVGQSYFIDQSEQYKPKPIQSEIKPRFHKTKNMLRTISNYLHKFILHSKRSKAFQERYFKMIINNREKKEKEELSKIENLQIQEVLQKAQENSVYKLSSDFDSKIEQQLSNVKLQSEEGGQDQQNNEKIDAKKYKKQLKEQEPNQNQKPESVIQQISELDKQISLEIERFHKWIANLSMINFADYQKIWSTSHEFLPLYRQICYKYYKQEVYCDVMRSRLTTKQITNKYMPQFIEGLFRPKQFFRFR